MLNEPLPKNEKLFFEVFEKDEWDPDYGVWVNLSSSHSSCEADSSTEHALKEDQNTDYLLFQGTTLQDFYTLALKILHSCNYQRAIEYDLVVGRTLEGNEGGAIEYSFSHKRLILVDGYGLVDSTSYTFSTLEQLAQLTSVI